MRKVIITTIFFSVVVVAVFVKNMGWVVSNKEFVAIIFSAIASLSSFVALLFSMYTFIHSNNMKRAMLGIKWEHPIFNTSKNMWLSLDVVNSGSATAINPTLELYIKSKSGFEKVYGRGYVYTMLPDHKFSFGLAGESMPSIQSNSELIAKVSYLSSSNENLSEYMAFTVTEVFIMNAGSGEMEDAAFLATSCLEIDAHNRITSDFKRSVG